MKQKFLVTGAGGMVGSHLVEFLKSKNCEVFGTYYKPTVDLNELNYNDPKHFFELDIRNKKQVEKIISKIKPDCIFHLAAQSFPVESWKDPYYTFDVNVKGTVALFESIKKLKSVEKNSTQLL